MNITKSHYSYRLQGALTGSTWWPTGAHCGFTIDYNLNRECGRITPADGLTLRDALLFLLGEHGGDFQGAEFTEDTFLTVTRYSNGQRSSRDWSITAFPSVSDLVAKDVYSSDFCDE